MKEKILINDQKDLKDRFQNKILIFDCNIWIRIILEHPNCAIEKKIKTLNASVLITSYMIIEILRVLKRISIRQTLDYSEMESYFWDFLNKAWIIKDFKRPFSDSIIIEVKKSPEFSIIAKLLEIEIKDVPYIVAAFEHDAILITNDIRSLVLKRDLIKKHLKIDVCSEQEFIES